MSARCFNLDCLSVPHRASADVKHFSLRLVRSSVGGPHLEDGRELRTGHALARAACTRDETFPQNDRTGFPALALRERQGDMAALGSVLQRPTPREQCRGIIPPRDDTAAARFTERADRGKGPGG